MEVRSHAIREQIPFRQASRSPVAQSAMVWQPSESCATGSSSQATRSAMARARPRSRQEFFNQIHLGKRSGKDNAFL